MGLGSCSLVTLAEARSKARDAARQLLHNVDPISAKRSTKRQALLTAAKDKTFKECAEAYIAMRERGWRNPRSSEQWHHSLSAFVYPKIGDLSVAAIDMGLVLGVLEPIWSKVPETASRVRARLEAILDWAKVHELRTGENPARWRKGQISGPTRAGRSAAGRSITPPCGMPRSARSWRSFGGDGKFGAALGVRHPNGD